MCCDEKAEKSMRAGWGNGTLGVLHVCVTLFVYRLLQKALFCNFKEGRKQGLPKQLTNGESRLGMESYR